MVSKCFGNWVHYFLGAVLAITMSWVLSGCRWGNNVVEPSSTDKYTGYYEMAPQKVTYTVVTSGTNGNVTTQKDGQPNQNPLSPALTNPILLYVASLDTGFSYFIETDVSLSDALKLPGQIDVNTGKIGFAYAYSPSPVWNNDTGCLGGLVYSVDGAIGSPNGPFTTGANVSLKGRIQATFTVVTNFLSGTASNTCPSILAAMASCYGDPSKCGGATDADNAKLQSSVAGTFGSYIAAGAMTGSDISKVVKLAYEVSYQ